MIAETLRCESCGAAVASDAQACGHCGSRLAASVCPGCLRMMFQGSKFCPHCGRPPIHWQPTDSPLPCPKCEVPMLRGEAGAYTLHECAKCFGVWVDRDTVENLCREAAREAVTGPSAAGPIQQASAPLAPIRYVKCPQCQGLMHRVNYGKSSGIVLDVCRAHGTWFDDRELTSIVAFIRAGGLDRAREREKAELAVERRRQATAAAQRSADYAEAREPDMFRLVLRSARGLFDTD